MLGKKRMFIYTGLFTLLLAGCNIANNSSSSSSTSSSSSKGGTSSTTQQQVSSEDSTSKVKPTRGHTHEFGEWEILVEADLFNSGEKTRQCLECDVSETVKYYDLSEVRFEDKIYQYNGETRTLTVDGLLPEGIDVKYTNNTLSEVGSVVSTAYFLDKDENVVETRTAALTIIPYRGLPNISVTTTGGAAINSKETYTVASVSVDNCESEYELNNVSAGIRLRGNGTLGSDKKPYRIKFDEKQKMLGLNNDAKAKSWVLLAEYYDYSMMRNATAFSLGDALMNGKGYYSSDFTHVNLYINGVFNGVYVLCEQQQVNKNRVNIYEPAENETNVKIGYLLELDNYAQSEGDYFMVGNSSYVAIDSTGATGTLPTRSYSIKSDYYSAEQISYISQYINNVYEIMYEAVIKGKYYALDENNNIVNSNYTTVYETLNAVIDIESLIRSYILEEIMKDVDVGFSSYYMFVDFSEGSQFPKLTFGAPWDFDWSSGNVTGGNMYKTSGEYNSTHMGYMNPWLFMISRTGFFTSSVQKYWRLMEKTNVMGKIIDEINYITQTFSSEFDKNFQKWKVLGTSQHSYHSSDVYGTTSHRDAVNCFTNWINNRKAYLDTIWQ